MKLHFFYPENDLALALDQTHYTPPPAASRLRVSGTALPLWYGGDGDRFIADGINARWLDEIRNTFGMDVEVYGSWSDGLEPAPWGWSRASRHALELRGVPVTALPDDRQLEAMRSLSHRCTSSLIASRLASVLPFVVAPAAQEIKSVDQAAIFLETASRAVFKLPWSSSGRGLIVLDRSEFAGRSQALAGAINRQGMIMAEPRMDKVQDFALLFTMKEGRCTYAGISVFDTVQFGSYASNRLAPQNELWEHVSALCPPGQLQAVAEALPAILQEIIGTSYDGPLGIDMMVVANAPYSLAPAVELNLRMTMGHVCRILYDRYVAPGAHGTFGVSTDRLTTDAAIRNGRLQRGRLVLSPPGTPFSFYVNVES